MDDTLVAAWASWQPDVRDRVLRIEEPGVAQLIDTNVRILWTAEMQAQRFGVKCAVNPFDTVKLPLMTTMQFDSSSADTPSVSVQSVSWPKSVHEDTLVIPSAIRNALQNSRRRRTPVRLCSTKWQQILQPPPKSWMDFERQLALLVEQLMLRAHARESEDNVLDDSEAAVADPSSVPPTTDAAEPVVAKCSGIVVDDETSEVAENTDGACTASGSIAAVAVDVGAEATAVESDNDGGTVAQDAASQEFTTARAAKRARQRERRRHGKAAARAAGSPFDGDDSGGGGGTIPGAVPVDASMPAVVSIPTLTSIPSPRDTTSPLPSCRSMPAVVTVPMDATYSGVHGSGGAVATVLPHLAPCEAENHGSGLVGDIGDVRRKEVDSGILNVLRKQVEQLSRDLDSRSSTVGSSSVRGAANSAVQRPRLGSGSKLGKRESNEDVMETPKLAGFGGAASGFGRGKPIGLRGQAQQGLVPHGRGRALEPPPGLQGLPAYGPGLQNPGLSQSTWLPGPGIPEDDEDRDLLSLPELNDACLDDWHYQDSDGARTPSGTLGADISRYWPKSSYASTPACPWSKTPSPPMTPGSLLQFGRSASVGTASPLQGPQLAPGFIPTYVTVPLALVNSCPHCGHAFALPSGRDETHGAGLPPSHFSLGVGHASPPE
eukprot:TRINITY_DN20677_c0_g1_i1.p1 TRINITY_DN20677_c0_g1~~TRINITY_DN20677_c0_g1_i1.p1  ORF type:complete len:661 (+),score=116.87 TRINITY_DN20677_c0_g1_i1:64-2046(+)